MRNVFRVGLLLSFSSVTAAFAQNDDVDVDVNANVNLNVGIQAGPGGASIKVGGADTQVHSHHTTVIIDPGVPQPVIIERRETVIIQQPAPQRPLFRDCGTGSDPGCTLVKDGNLPMDAETFRGFISSLKATANELVREEMAEKMIRKNYLTALQFGRLLDLFTNELTRLDVAKVATPHVVNPQHALGFASKWNNSLTGAEYTELISDQH